MSCEHDDLEDDGWECPTCLRPMPAEIDYECGTCESMASQHLRVTTLCKLLRETQRRESCLIVENNRIKSQLGDAKATADLWIQKAKEAEQAAADLKAELEDTRREWKAELEEQARLLGMSAERECDLRGKLDRERALADRLAALLQRNRDLYGGQQVDPQCGCWECEYLGPIDDALNAWKEARSE